MTNGDRRGFSEKRKLQLGCAGLSVLLAVMQSQALTLLDEPQAACLVHEVTVLPALQSDQDDRDFLAWAVQEHRVAVSADQAPSNVGHPEVQPLRHWRST